MSDAKIKFTINYDLRSSYKNFGTGQKEISLEKNPVTGKRTWSMTKIVTKYKEFEGLTPAETVIKLPKSNITIKDIWQQQNIQKTKEA